VQTYHVAQTIRFRETGHQKIKGTVRETDFKGIKNKRNTDIGTVCLIQTHA
jgi:hypothetical protein